MINYNDAFNSARLIPGAHRYLPGWKKKSKAFREMMDEQSKAQIDMVYDEDEICQWMFSVLGHTSKQL